ncbi:MAG: hypothetical protein JWP77_2338 [Polaromonas sp.]|jgi:hypothetical protein|nr:hypothetical protein [Polaromonas sp.]MDB5939974.1 hypothetical protein [Polaromonas sp.]
MNGKFSLRHRFQRRQEYREVGIPGSDDTRRTRQLEALLNKYLDKAKTNLWIEPEVSNRVWGRNVRNQDCVISVGHENFLRGYIRRAVLIDSCQPTKDAGFNVFQNACREHSDCLYSFQTFIRTTCCGWCISWPAFPNPTYSQSNTAPLTGAVDVMVAPRVRTRPEASHDIAFGARSVGVVARRTVLHSKHQQDDGADHRNEGQ